MTARPGFYVVLGDLNRLVVVEDALGLPAPAVRFRTRQHAEAIRDRLNADLFAERDFGKERGAA